jgi:hypothetical protein
VGGGDDRRRLDLVQEAPHDRADAPAGGARTRAGDRAGGADQIEQVRALGVIESQRPRQRLEDLLGHAGHLAALEPAVVVRADTGQRGNLFPAKPGHPPLAVAGQTDLLGRQLRPAGGQEFGDVRC